MNIRLISIATLSALTLTSFSSASEMNELSQPQPSEITFKLENERGLVQSYTTSLTLSVPSVFEHELIETRPLGSYSVTDEDGKTVSKLNYSAVPTEELKGRVVLHTHNEIELDLSFTLLESVNRTEDGIELPSYRTVRYAQVFKAESQGTLAKFSTPETDSFIDTNDLLKKEGDMYKLSYELK